MRTANGTTKRLFVAMPLPAEVLILATRVQRAIGQECRARLVSTDQLHCTFAFIGSVDMIGVEKARRVVAGIPTESGGHACTDGIVLLRSARRTRVVALGLDDCGGTLARLHGRVVCGLEAEGLTLEDRRPFRAHVTVARVRDPGLVQPMAECERIRFGVESVCLYESVLRREGPVYSLLERVDLQKAHGQEKA